MFIIKAIDTIHCCYFWSLESSGIVVFEVKFESVGIMWTDCENCWRKNSCRPERKLTFSELKIWKKISKSKRNVFKSNQSKMLGMIKKGETKYVLNDANQFAWNELKSLTL